MMKLLLLLFWISLLQVFCVCFVVQADTGLLLASTASNGERHSEEYCAMYDICGTSDDGKVLNCPYGSPSIKPDDLFLRKIQSLCPAITGNVCCTEAQFDALRAQVLHAIPFLVGCPACLRNYLNLFCELSCSPRQSLFINATSVSKGNNKLTVDAIDFYITDAFGEGLYDSCKDVKFGSLNIRALDIIGAGAQNFKGRRVDYNMPGSSYAITFRLIAPESSGMKPMNISTYSCGDVTLGCSCGDCSSSAVCANTPSLSQDDVGSCSIRIGSVKVKCIFFGLTILYVVLVSMVFRWSLLHCKREKVQSTRMKPLINLNISDDVEIDSTVRLAEATLPTEVSQSTIMEAMANLNISNGIEVESTIKLAEVTFLEQVSQSTRMKLLTDSNISDGAEVDSAIKLTEVTIPMQVSQSTRMEPLANSNISSNDEEDFANWLAEAILPIQVPQSIRIESLKNLNISNSAEVNSAIKLAEVTIPMQVPQSTRMEPLANLNISSSAEEDFANWLEEAILPMQVPQSIRMESLKNSNISNSVEVDFATWMVETTLPIQVPQLTRLELQANSNILDNIEVDYAIKLANATFPMQVSQSTRMESLTNSNILDNAEVDFAIWLAETTLPKQMSQLTRMEPLTNSNMSNDAEVYSAMRLTETTLPTQVSQSTRMELLTNSNISNGAKVDSAITLEEVTLPIQVSQSIRIEPLANLNISYGAEVDSSIRLTELTLPMQVPQILGDGSNGNRIMTQYLKIFTLTELKSATMNFSLDMVIGEGGFGMVFEGWIDEKTYAPSKVGVGMAVAIKKSKPNSSQGQRQWQAEVEFLGKFCHPNLVKLLGYCSEEGQFLLVYEYMQAGSLENHLFRNEAQQLPWEIRLNIAIGAARGLAYLHNWEESVIYRDFKTSNILLDFEYNAKLSDFGLAKVGPINGNSHVTTQAMGTYGYIAPEYATTGRLYVKSDVYGFGVVLLELLTGLRALDPKRPYGQYSLVEWAKPFLSNKKKPMKIVDPRLKGQYPIKAATRIAELISRCLESEPNCRPSMEEVLFFLIEASKCAKFLNGKIVEPGGTRYWDGGLPPFKGGNKIMTRNLKIFTLKALRSATGNFSSDLLIGRGVFGRVYKGWIDENTYAPSKLGVGMAVAVKRLSPENRQGRREWLAEVEFLGKFCHPNLLKLLGYCREEPELLLVYEYMQKGSLDKHLFTDEAKLLSWEIRLKIAIGAVRGLTYLHNREQCVIHRHFKPANILLDSEYNAKLSDFGLAILGPITGNSHVTTQIVGTIGYIAPEYFYAMLGRPCVKSDVYGVGAVLLDLLTGSWVRGHNRSSCEHSLVEWVKRSLSNKSELSKIMDPRLEEQYPIEAATQIAQLILRCLESDPNSRPSAEEVLDALIKASAASEKTMESTDTA